MKCGPWGDYFELLDAICRGNGPVSYDGRRPVAIERTSKQARLLYSLPHSDREPSHSGTTALPEYVYLDD